MAYMKTNWVFKQHKFFWSVHEPQHYRYRRDRILRKRSLRRISRFYESLCAAEMRMKLELSSWLCRTLFTVSYPRFTHYYSWLFYSFAKWSTNFVAILCLLQTLEQDLVGYRLILFHELTAMRSKFICEDTLNVAYVGMVSFDAPNHSFVTKLCVHDKQDVWAPVFLSDIVVCTNIVSVHVPRKVAYRTDAHQQISMDFQPTSQSKLRTKKGLSSWLYGILCTDS